MSAYLTRKDLYADYNDARYIIPPVAEAWPKSSISLLTQFTSHTMGLAFLNETMASSIIT